MTCSQHFQPKWFVLFRELLQKLTFVISPSSDYWLKWLIQEKRWY